MKSQRSADLGTRNVRVEYQSASGQEAEHESIEQEAAAARGQPRHGEAKEGARVAAHCEQRARHSAYTASEWNILIYVN